MHRQHSHHYVILHTTDTHLHLTTKHLIQQEDHQMLRRCEPHFWHLQMITIRFAKFNLYYKDRTVWFSVCVTSAKHDTQCDCVLFPITVLYSNMLLAPFLRLLPFKCKSPHFSISNWSPSVKWSQDTTIQVGFGMQTAKTLTYPVMCPFPLSAALYTHNPPMLQRADSRSSTTTEHVMLKA